MTACLSSAGAFKVTIWRCSLVKAALRRSHPWTCPGSDLVGHQLPIGGVILSDIGQEALLRLPLQEVEVLLKVIGEKDAVVILKVLVQLFKYFAECVTLLHILDGIVLEEFPGHAAETSKDVQHCDSPARLLMTIFLW